MNFSRRKLLTGGAAFGAMAAWPTMTTAALAGFTLRVVKRNIEVNGRAASVFGIQQPDGTAGLKLIHGMSFGMRLENQSDEETLVHWHGLAPPPEQDGVPGLSQSLLAPGAAYEYGFPLRRPGTFWMHSHYGLQEQQLLAAPLIVNDPIDFFTGLTDVVIMLHDFTFRDPQEIYAELTHGGMMMDHSAMGEGMDMGEGGMSGMDRGAMPMGMAHLNDVEFDAYLANDRTLDDPEIVAVEPNRGVRLRIINASASTNFWIDLGALKGVLLAVDGSDCLAADGSGTPAGRWFPLAMSQRIDIGLCITCRPAPIRSWRSAKATRRGLASSLATPRRRDRPRAERAPPNRRRR